jgi:splicing factor 3A subunit 1
LDKELGPEEPTASANQAQAPEAPPAHDQPEIHQHMVPPNIGGPIKIRTDYKPKLGQQNKIVQESQICPRCGESIPVSEMDEHMRIELLDPKWKEQKLAQEAKLRDSNLLQEGTDVAKILTNFAGYRSDIFGSNETGIGRKISEEEAARQREQQHALWEQQNAAAMNDVQSSRYLEKRGSMILY